MGLAARKRVNNVYKYIAAWYAISKPNAMPSGIWNSSRFGRQLNVLWLAGVIASRVR